MQSLNSYEAKFMSPRACRNIFIDISVTEHRDNISVLKPQFQNLFNSLNFRTDRRQQLTFFFFIYHSSFLRACCREKPFTKGCSIYQEEVCCFFWAIASIFQAYGIQMPLWKQRSLSWGRHTHTPHKNRLTSQNQLWFGMQVLSYRCCRARGAPQMCLL